MNKRVIIILTAIFALSVLWMKFSFAATRPLNKQQFLQQFQAGESAFAKKNYPAAIRFFQQTLRLKPTQLRPRFRLGQAFLALGQHNASVQQFQAILSRSPNHISARLGMIRGLLGMNRVSDAEKQLKWILQIDPENHEARQIYQTCHSRLVPSPSAAAARINIATGNTPNPAAGPEFVPAGFKPLPVTKAGVEALEKPAKQNSQAARDGFIPLSRQAHKPTQVIRQPKPAKIPPPAMDVEGWQVKDFLTMAEGSYGVSLEYAKYCLERDNLDKTQRYLDRAEKLAAKAKNPKQFLEVQIHRCLQLLYKAEIRRFGKKIMKIKPLLSDKTYKSFLDVYNRASTATSPVDVARLVGGIAMGAEHFAVAARIFSEVVTRAPNDLLTWKLLSEAQLMNRDFTAAEYSLTQVLRLAPDSGEHALNIARFYLTGKYMPSKVRYYIEYARQRTPDDPRIPVILALLDYTEGRLEQGLARLQKFIHKIGKDKALQRVCQRIIQDGTNARKFGKNAGQHFIQLLALPGSRYATAASWNLLGESYLQRGSYFLAFMCYMKSKDLAEIGRTYLGLASRFYSIGEVKTAALAAGYGLNALRDDISHNHSSSRGELYLALYHAERKNVAAAQMHAKKGLNTNPPPTTRRRLMACLSALTH